jgi:hypothetical protein
VVFLPDGKTLASASGDLTLRLWEASTGRPVRQQRLPGGATDPDGWFAADGSTLTWRDGKRVVQLDVATGKTLRSFDFPEVVYHCDLSPDGNFLAAYGRDRVLRVVDRTTGKAVPEFVKYTEPVAGLAFAPDARTLAVSLEDDTIRLADPTTGKERQMLRFPASPTVFGFSPDSKTLTVALADHRLVLVEVDTGKEILAFRMPEHAARLAYWPGGMLLAAGTESGTIHLWELATGKQVAQVEGHRGGVSCLAFSADGRRLASGGHDTTVLTWDVLNLNGEAPAAGDFTPKDLEALWADLGSADAAQAYRAVRALVAVPDKGLPFLRQHLRPDPAPDPKHLARLIADLDDDKFEVREKATRDLEDLGSSARPALRKVLAGQPSAEVRRRLEGLLQRPEQFLLSPGDLRGLRAVAVLERIGTAEPRELLERLVREGSDTSPLARDAAAALERLWRRSAKP